MFNTASRTLFGILLLLFSSCGAVDQVKEVVKLLDHAISELDRNSGDWQNIISQLASDLPEEASSLIRNDIQTLANNVIGASGAELRCNTDFFANRLKQDLGNLKALVLGGETKPTNPEFCTVSLPNINLNDKPLDKHELILYGYDFFKKDQKGKRVTAYLQGIGGKKTEISRDRIGINNNYQMTLNITGLAPSLHSQRISKILFGFGGTTDGFPEVIVNQWIPKTKTIKNRAVNQLTFQPPNRNVPALRYTVGGDKDFDTGSNDPTKVKLKTEVKRNAYRLEARVYMYARESKGDHTRLGGWSDWKTLYTVPKNYRLVSFSPTVNTMLEVEVTEKGLQTFSMGGECVSNYKLYLDRKGDDRGSYTRVVVNWNNFDLEIQELRPNF